MDKIDILIVFLSGISAWFLLRPVKKKIKDDYELALEQIKYDDEIEESILGVNCHFWDINCQNLLNL
jgi:hypothetical protein